MKCNFCTSENTELKQVVSHGKYSLYWYDCNNCKTPFTVNRLTEQVAKTVSDDDVYGAWQNSIKKYYCDPSDFEPDN